MTMKVKSLAKTNGMNILKRPLAYATAISVSFTKERITCLQVPAVLPCACSRKMLKNKFKLNNQVSFVYSWNDILQGFFPSNAFNE